MTLAVRGRSKGPTAEVAGKSTVRPLLCKNNKVYEMTPGITIAVQRKIEAKCMMLWSRGALIVVFHSLIFHFAFVCDF